MLLNGERSEIELFEAHAVHSLVVQTGRQWLTTARL
jgi:hypothetical protein